MMAHEDRRGGEKREQNERRTEREERKLGGVNSRQIKQE